MSGEPSYYEIALTHRQVVVAFVVLLGCLVVAFFSGVWVGRGEMEAAPADGVAGSELPTEDIDGSAVEEFRFFTEDDPTETRPTTPSTLREDLAAGTLPRPEEQEPPSPPPPAAPPARATPPASPPAAAGSAAGGQVMIQVFSSADRGKAQTILQRLRAADHPALLSPIEVEGTTMYRVRVGPFGDREDAERVAALLRRELGLETWITAR